MPRAEKRICLIINSLVGGGAERKVLTIAGAMVSLGHHAHVVLLNDQVAYPVPDGVRTHTVYPAGVRHLDYFWRIHRTARDLRALIERVESRHGRFDLFVSNLNWTNKIVARLDLRSVYFMIRNSVGGELARARKLGPIQYRRMLSAHAALDGKDVITVSRGLEEEIRREGRLRPRSIRTILNPFDIEGIRAMAEEPDAEIPDEHYLIHVARFARQKRHDVLFRALREVDASYRLVLLCKQRDKALRSAERYGVAHRVQVPGFRPNPYPWIRRARLLLLSSDYEGFANVLVESLICGTPVVSTRCPQSPDEILTGPLARWLVPCRDPGALASRVNEALATRIDVSDAPILQKVGAERIAEQYLELADGAAPHGT
jgi:glycosyltransferase involved in cell wall biosynthesis